MWRMFLLLCVAIFVFTSNSLAETVKLERGWNLLGSSCEVLLEEISNPSIRSVWTWDEKKKEWNFWSPFENLREIASLYNIPEINGVIEPFKGFWIQSEGNMTLSLCEYSSEEELIAVYGKVRKINIEGGFYGIEDISGEEYLPINNDQFKELAGSCVKGMAKIEKEANTFYQWGIPVRFLTYKVVPCSIRETDNQTNLEGNGTLAFYPLNNVRKVMVVDNGTVAFQYQNMICVVDRNNFMEGKKGNCLVENGKILDWDIKDNWLVKFVEESEGNALLVVESLNTSSGNSSFSLGNLGNGIGRIKILKTTDNSVNFVATTPYTMYLGYSDGNETTVLDAKAFGNSIVSYQIYDMDTYYPYVFAQTESLGVSVFDTSNGSLEEVECCAIDSYHSRYVDASKYPEILIAGPVMYQGMNEEEIGHLDCGIGLVNIETKQIEVCIRDINAEKAIFVSDSPKIVAVLTSDSNEVKVINLDNQKPVENIKLNTHINDISYIGNGILAIATDSGIYLYESKE